MKYDCTSTLKLSCYSKAICEDQKILYLTIMFI